jgi:hypothetical protein
MKSNLEPPLAPPLAPPGAGLPRIELLIARLLFATQRATGNVATFNSRLERERTTIRRLLQGLEGDAAARRVLIRRPPGLEDSSRYWSVWMTLEHLRMVNEGAVRVITGLTHGTMPPGKASTAAVKPSPQVTGAVVGEYEKSCDALSAAAAGGKLRTPLRFPHPWFGPLDAAGWHALATVHLGLHRVQIERIIAGLRTL